MPGGAKRRNTCVVGADNALWMSYYTCDDPFYSNWHFHKCAVRTIKTAGLKNQQVSDLGTHEIVLTCCSITRLHDRALSVLKNTHILFPCI